MLTVYSTTWCGDCHRLKTQLDREGIPYTSIDIEADEQAAAFVASVNNGNHSVPTVRCPNGTTMTEPTIAQIKACLAPASA